MSRGVARDGARRHCKMPLPRFRGPSLAAPASIVETRTTGSDEWCMLPRLPPDTDR